jgi:two-component system alkaline phosphatase synthesis response regulator PhoP
LASAGLARFGAMEVVEAEDGVSGVQTALEQRPDAILLDMFMPGLDGRATLAALRSNPCTRAIPVVFLTGIAGSRDAETLTSLGARGVLAKPFNPKLLASQVAEVLAQ